MRKTTLALIPITIVGLLLRGLHLEWQPLWWDEGYSAYVSTESLPQMLWLTAHDIHPPLYYALLHGWLTLLQSTKPFALRTFSLLIGTLTLPLFAWMTHLLFPQRRRLLLLATLLLLFNPMHLFYSQEIRMYALALALGIISTAFYWQLLATAQRGSRSPIVPWIGYTLSACLALYTLYYSGFLLIAHLAFALWIFRQNLRTALTALSTQLAAGLLYLPWLLYAGPKLILYVDDKVVADADQPLGLLEYGLRHLLAFTGGHLAPIELSLNVARYVGLVALLPLALIAAYRWWNQSPLRSQQEEQSLLNGRTAVTFLWFMLLIPSTIAFAVNLYRPFFPTGGERLLLFILPYFLLLIAQVIDTHWNWRSGKPIFTALLVAAIAGIVTFYTQPRYLDRDYRPLIQQAVQQGNDDDTFLAIFPWQVGFWRAYGVDPAQNSAPDSAPSDAEKLDTPIIVGPQAVLLGQGSLEWDATLAAQIDTILEEGTLWFPEPESLGSTLPAAIETYLSAQTDADPDAGVEPLFNLENRWANPTTRLTAWRRVSTPTISQPVDAQWTIGSATLQLTNSALTATEIATANQLLGIDLQWDLPPEMHEDLRVSLRLQDEEGYIWANRDYTPFGAYTIAVQPYTIERLGLMVPVGLPPGSYNLVLGIGPSDAKTLTPLKNEPSEVVAIIGQINIIAPSAILSPQRLPIQHWLAQPQRVNELTFLGFSGYKEGDRILAGDAFSPSLFLQSNSDSVPVYNLYISLLDKNGASVAGWEGWTLPNYPTIDWAAGALVRVPVRFFLPAAVSSGEYQLITGLLDPTTGTKTEPVTLGSLLVEQRAARFDAPAITFPLKDPVQFGSHISLLGYDLMAVEEGAAAKLLLHWQVLQPLLPPHHIFVHLDQKGADGLLVTLLQDDGPPITFASGAATSDAKDDSLIKAPSGSWQVGEYLTTQHRLTVPPDSVVNIDNGQLLIDGRPLMLTVGLYQPESGQRLPASVDGVVTGDSATLVGAE